MKTDNQDKINYFDTCILAAVGKVLIEFEAELRDAECQLFS